MFRLLNGVRKPMRLKKRLQRMDKELRLIRKDFAAVLVLKADNYALNCTVARLCGENDAFRRREAVLQARIKELEESSRIVGPGTAPTAADVFAASRQHRRSTH